MQNPISSITKNISSKILRKTVTGMLNNSFAGFVLGTGITYLNEGSFSSALEAGFDGFVQGAIIGAITGTAQGIVENRIAGKNALIEVKAEDLHIEDEVQRIKEGIIYNQYRHDGTEFHNNPMKQGGYLPQGILYKEYVVPTYGIPGPGVQRIVIGNDGSWYYTPDHYKTFIKFKP